MRLSDEQIYEFKQIYAIRGKYRLHLDDDYILVSVKRANDLLDTIEALQQENEQLRAQAARIPDICKWWDGWSCTAYQSDEMKCPHCCPNWEGDNKYAVYHNSADVEALKKAKEILSTMKENYIFVPARMQEILDDVLAEIDKAIGGGQGDEQRNK